MKDKDFIRTQLQINTNFEKLVLKCVPARVIINGCHQLGSHNTGTLTPTGISNAEPKTLNNDCESYRPSVLRLLKCNVAD